MSGMGEGAGQYTRSPFRRRVRRRLRHCLGRPPRRDADRPSEQAPAPAPQRPNAPSLESAPDAEASRAARPAPVAPRAGVLPVRAQLASPQAPAARRRRPRTRPESPARASSRHAHAMPARPHRPARTSTTMRILAMHHRWPPRSPGPQPRPGPGRRPASGPKQKAPTDTTPMGPCARWEAPQRRLKTSVPLVPPNPKLFFRATSIVRSRAVLAQ